MIIRARHCSPNEYNFYTKIEPELNLVIDAGASNTFFNQLECEVHFFEPDTKLYQSLISLNDQNKTHYYNKLGLGNASTKTLLYNELGSVVKWDCTKLGIRAKNLNVNEEIEIIRLEDYLISNNIQNISLLKVDVEGMDYEVIEGLGSFIDKCDYITFEFQGHIKEWNVNGPENTFKQYQDLLVNYDLHNINVDGSLSEITSAHYKGCHNFVAINKNKQSI